MISLEQIIIGLGALDCNFSIDITKISCETLAIVSKCTEVLGFEMKRPPSKPFDELRFPCIELTFCYPILIIPCEEVLYPIQAAY